MPHIFIDGKKLEAANDKTIIQIAVENGIDIPHFCWHPELSVSGNCRMCLVEVGMPKRLADGSIEKDEVGDSQINYFPKLQIACATPVSDGMHVRTISDKVLTARESVMEFFLINHPLDCPICDEAGQCKLQEYAFNHSSGSSRFEENKNPKDKRVPWGPEVMYDAERCISCSRCIRFAQEVANQDVLTFVSRGDHVTIELFENTKFDNDYSMNVIDICPVGALTSSDFRFKSRVWDMSFNDSICPGCSRGCNIKLGIRNNEILRIEPRTNPYVNKYWMCDYGRLSYYKQINENRLLTPLIKSEGKLSEIKYNDAISIAFESLKKYKDNEVLFIASPFESLEDNYVFLQFSKLIYKNPQIGAFKYIDNQFADELLKTNDKSPNYKGLTAIGAQPENEYLDAGSLAELINHGKIRAIYSLDDKLLEFPSLAEAMGKLELLIVHQTNLNELSAYSHLIFPATTFAESEGTFVNSDSRVQYFEPALITAENLRFMGMKQSRLDKFGALNDRWSNHQNRPIRSSWRIIMQLSNLFGSALNYKSSADIFTEISSHIDAFKNMDYPKLKLHQGIKLFNGSKPDPIVLNYVPQFMKPE